MLIHVCDYIRIGESPRNLSLNWHFLIIDVVWVCYHLLTYSSYQLGNHPNCCLLKDAIFLSFFFASLLKDHFWPSLDPNLFFCVSFVHFCILFFYSIIKSLALSLQIITWKSLWKSFEWDSFFYIFVILFLLRIHNKSRRKNATHRRGQ